MAAMDIQQRDDLAFPRSLPEFQQLFSDDAACAGYLGRARWPNGFVCPHCGPSPSALSPDRVFWSAVRAAAKPASWSARSWNASHTPLSVWFWAAYLVASQTPGMSAVQFRGNLG